MRRCYRSVNTVAIDRIGGRIKRVALLKRASNATILCLRVNVGTNGMKHLLICLAVLAVVSGCGDRRMEPTGAQSPLVYDANAVARSEKVAIFIPGALAPVDIFQAASNWADRGYALVYYRFPGLDDLPLDHRLDIDVAANTVSDFSNRYPDKSFALIGYSTGAPIAFMAAPDIASQTPVTVVALSPAVEHAGGLATALRGFQDVASAALRAGSLDPEKVWPLYWQTLLYGRKGLDDPSLQQDIERLSEEQAAHIIVPDADLTRAHTADLRRWHLPDDLDLRSVKIGFFVGLNDPVFSTRQTQQFANELGIGTIYGYPGQGHLLFFTRNGIFDDIFDFIESDFDSLEELHVQ
jgi:pimeloyl-ACP methyl ester carboxylesterase